MKLPLPVSSSASSATALALLFSLAFTRSGHFGSVVSLPDASLAVFFLLGLLGTAAWWFAVALGLAAAVDSIVIAGGVSTAHITPAYIFLVPTYGAMWWAGRLVVRHMASFGPTAGLVLLASMASLGTVVAFSISNGSFYAYSGLFTDLSVTAYATQVAEYFPGYFGYTALYVATALALATAVRAVADRTKARARGRPILHG